MPPLQLIGPNFGNTWNHRPDERRYTFGKRGVLISVTSEMSTGEIYIECMEYKNIKLEGKDRFLLAEALSMAQLGDARTAVHELLSLPVADRKYDECLDAINNLLEIEMFVAEKVWREREKIKLEAGKRYRSAVALLKTEFDMEPKIQREKEEAGGCQSKGEGAGKDVQDQLAVVKTDDTSKRGANEMEPSSSNDEERPSKRRETELAPVVNELSNASEEIPKTPPQVPQPSKKTSAAKPDSTISSDHPKTSKPHDVAKSIPKFTEAETKEIADIRNSNEFLSKNNWSNIVFIASSDISPRNASARAEIVAIVHEFDPQEWKSLNSDGHGYYLNFGRSRQGKDVAKMFHTKYNGRNLHCGVKLVLKLFVANNKREKYKKPKTKEPAVHESSGHRIEKSTEKKRTEEGKKTEKLSTNQTKKKTENEQTEEKTKTDKPATFQIEEVGSKDVKAK